MNEILVSQKLWPPDLTEIQQQAQPRHLKALFYLFQIKIRLVIDIVHISQGRFFLTYFLCFIAIL